MIKIGITDMMAPDITTSHFVAVMYCFEIEFNPWVSIYLSILDMNNNGFMNSFHIPMKTKTAWVAMEAFMFGSTIRKKVPNLDNPSMAAASSTSLGKLTKNCRIIKIYVILIIVVSIRAPWVSTRPRPETTI